MSVVSASQSTPRMMDRDQRNDGVGLVLDRINMQFGSRRVLQNVSFSIAAGEFVAVVGRSGSGKSTLLRIVAGLQLPTSGTVTFQGEPITGLNRACRVMFQDSRLLPWLRVRENVLLGLPRTAHQRAAAALEQVGLADRGDDWPAVLSGGQKQRIALARALAGEPMLLLLDEPLGSLDALTRLEMQSLIGRVWEADGFGALLITHDIEEAVALADRVLILADGEIRHDVNIAMERPRPRNSIAFVEHVQSILDRLPAIESKPV